MCLVHSAPDLKAIERAGQDAAFRPVSANPYRQATPEYDAWARGFWFAVDRR